jgi:hypothetical protein
MYSLVVAVCTVCVVAVCTVCVVAVYTVCHKTDFINGCVYVISRIYSVYYLMMDSPPC